jgi:uncharacterized protein
MFPIGATLSYQPRIVDSELADRLTSTGAVVIEGPRACGKTATARRAAGSEVLLDVDRAARVAAGVDPGLILAGRTPRLIDEWQIEPDIWNHVRRAVDERAAPGQFILTGSALPADDATRHTGAGRFGRLRMRPMSLLESGHSTGAVSLAALFDGVTDGAADPGLSVPDLAERIVVGGWPGLQRLSTLGAARSVRDYLDEVVRVDVARAEDRRPEFDRVAVVARSLARNTATYAAATTIAADAGGPDGPLSDDSVRSYLAALTRVMVTEDQPAWTTRLRSRSTLRSSPKRHFVDPSLAAAALRATPQRLLADLETMGFLFESLVVRDLRVYAQANDATVLQYRDNTGLEVDAVVQAADGRWGALEVKLGTRAVDDAAATLLRFADRVDTDHVGAPSMLGVIVSTGPGYRRPDGVHVIPIGALGP